MKKVCFFALFLLVLKVSGQNHSPIAVNDTVHTYYGYDMYFYPLLNDSDPDQDSLFFSSSSIYSQVDDSTWKISQDALENARPYDSIYYLKYFVSDEHYLVSIGTVVIILDAAVKSNFLDINNFRALISPFGNHFWDLDTLRSENPNGSGLSSILNQTVWIGGIAPDEYLYLGGEMQQNNGRDFFTGPKSDVYDSTYQKKWHRLWKLNKSEIIHHIEHWTDAGYEPIEAIASWPVTGDTTISQLASIAPFYDYNLDGLYQPSEGDYPMIRGDQAIFWVMNDSRAMHLETDGFPMGIDILGMAYAFDRPEDSTLNNTVFFHYDVINRSDSEYHDTYFGIYSKFSIGDPSDDYLASDVANGMYYAYNSDSIDHSVNLGYGVHPPALGMKMIGGIYLPPDGLDNPAGNCNEGINGLNFGDGIADNERTGMSTFVTGWLIGPYGIFAPSYYQILKGLMYDDTPFQYGCKMMESGFGTFYNSGGMGPSCRYLYPGDSDTLCNWGTNGTMPEAGFNQNGKYWTESFAPNPPGYRDGVGAVGPFTFSPGQSVPMDWCFTFARDNSGDHHSSANLLRERISGMKPYWNSLIQLQGFSLGIPEQKEKAAIRIYPNPFTDNARIVLESIEARPFYLYTINGQIIRTGWMQPGLNIIDLKELAPGVYIIRSSGVSGKLIKM